MANHQGKKFKRVKGVYFIGVGDPSLIIVEVKPKCRAWYYASPSATPLLEAFIGAERARKGLLYDTMETILVDNFNIQNRPSMDKDLESFVDKMLERELIEEDNRNPWPPPSPPAHKQEYTELKFMDSLPDEFLRNVPVSGGGRS